MWIEVGEKVREIMEKLIEDDEFSEWPEESAIRALDSGHLGVRFINLVLL